MSFVPENELEKAMLLAASQEDARPPFYRLLLESELFVIGDAPTPKLTGTAQGQTTMQIEQIFNDGKTVHPIFSSQKRLADFAPGRSEFFRMQGRLLFESTRGAAFLLNPGSGLSKTLVAEEIAYCLAHFGEVETRPAFVVSLPKVLPKKLVRALCVLFVSRAAVKSAHLAAVAREGETDKPHPLIGLVTDGDPAKLTDEVLAAAAAAMPGLQVDVVCIDPDGPLDELRSRLTSIAPFYKRTYTLN